MINDREDWTEMEYEKADIKKRMQYILNMRPVFNKEALFSDGTEYYRTPAEPKAGDTVTIKFRTQRNNVDSVYLVSQEQRVQMEICETENGFDYYSAQVTIGADIFRYYFEIQYGCVTCYYNNQGVCMKHEGRMDFEIYPGFDTPKWAKGAVMYQIYVDRFLNGDPTNDVVTGEYHYIGDKSVQDVCEAQGVDYRTFLAVANFISEEQYTYSGDENVFSISALMDYLKRAHTYFLDFKLPVIRRKLIEAIDCSGTDNIAYLILKFFDEYAKEVRRHMEYENEAVFTYVEKLLEGKLAENYDIATFASKHNQIESKLTELKNIIIKYYPEKENNNKLNAVLFDIFNCEHDLASHCQVEDYMFVPAVAQLERRLKNEQ